MLRRKMVMASALAITVTLSAPLSAAAAPSSSPSTGSSSSAPSDPSGTGGQATQEIANLQQQIDQLNAQMLAAADAANQAVGQASVAKDAATQAKADLDQANADLDFAKKKANNVAADLYKQGPLSLTQSTLLSSDGPQDFIDKAVLTDQVGDYQVENINAMLDAQKKQQEASTAADAAAADAQAKADEAQKVSSDTQAQLTAAQAQMNDLRIKAGMPPQVDENTPQGVTADSSGVTGQVTGEWALPASGTFTSCFCPRWGTFHQGIDIAGPIGTPIFAAGSGVVLRAGPATGFGLAVYIQHPNGDVTVYGHVDKYNVQTGQSVSAGQKIADMGNRGYSTGPHLHFEVQKGAYGSRVDPQAWLASRGIMVG
ncbi:M23 family metallopeptidase [Blastococcus sp. Marseille-P5729]|uniref:M23 family metallopeptidase n=1 Tax=Blastococcus sp. Marseille-P5729 TaxID=2086582 RepID=UPI000D0F757A|nr:M23 family metallopeptidase [Blastococcus sp. Marseille-P5729]